MRRMGVGGVKMGKSNISGVLEGGGSYTTEDEIRFIMGLPYEKLNRYREALVLRERWDGIDRDRVIRYLDELLRG